MKILVIYGGFGLSDEAEISVASGREVALALREAGHEVAEFKLTQENLKELADKVADFEMVFPVLHGAYGEGGELQRMLEERGVSFVGSGSKASRVCLDKNLYKMKLLEEGIPTPHWRVISDLSQAEDLTYPVIFKPVDGGSSIGMMKADSYATLDQEALASLLHRYGQLMAEEYIAGDEITVGILEDEALPVVGIRLAEGEWFDFDKKYSGHTEEVVNPEYIKEDVLRRAQSLAMKIHTLMDCRDLSRTDMMVRDNELYVLETNTIPGETLNSLYPKAAEAAGYPMKLLVDKLVQGAQKLINTN